MCCVGGGEAVSAARQRQQRALQRQALRRQAVPRRRHRLSPSSPLNSESSSAASSSSGGGASCSRAEARGGRGTAALLRRRGTAAAAAAPRPLVDATLRGLAPTPGSRAAAMHAAMAALGRWGRRARWGREAVARGGSAAAACLCGMSEEEMLERCSAEWPGALACIHLCGGGAADGPLRPAGGWPKWRRCAANVPLRAPWQEVPPISSAPGSSRAGQQVRRRHGIPRSGLLPAARARVHWRRRAELGAWARRHNACAPAQAAPLARPPAP